MRLWIGLAAVNGFLAVAMAAALAHGVAIADLATARAAIAASTLHLIHAAAMLGLGLARGLLAPSRLFAAVGAGFQAGAVLFSGALYVYVITGAPAFAHMAPFGGIAYMLGWLALLAAALRARPLEN
ncbi:MAG: hypothetical protein Tsb0010_06770 [Parvularculaceae bacterium]